MTDYKAVAASLRACTDPQKHHAANVIDELAGGLSDATNALNLLLREVVASGNAESKNDGWPKAIEASLKVLGLRLTPLVEIVVIDRDAAMKEPK